MRKWMRERLQRRKKTPAAPSDQPAPPPLQPAYFDAEQPPSTVSAEGKTEAEIAAPPSSEPAARPVRRARSNAANVDEQPLEVKRSEVQRSEEQRSEDQRSEAQPASSQPSPSTSNSGRGRRRRGGRGRGGRGREQAVAQAFAPAAVKGSVPVLEPAEEIQPAEDEFSGVPPAQLQTPQVPSEAPKAPVIPVAQQRP